MKNLHTLFVCSLACALFGSLPLASGSEPDLSVLKDRPTLLLVEQDQHPTATVSWVRDREWHRFGKSMPFTAPTGGEPVGHNVKCYVTMGGSRIETGAGHPKGAVVRLGVTKIENARAFFAGIDPHTVIEFAIDGVRFNQPVKYHQGTGIMHLKYALGDLEACALPATARNQYLLSNPQDTLGGRVIPGENATPGALDGGEGHGGFIIEIDEDDPTLVSMRIRVPFGQLRHLQDPWKSDLPGTFFEPVHMHAEAEFIPIHVAPLNRAPILPESNEPIQEPNSSIQSDNQASEDSTNKE